MACRPRDIVNLVSILGARRTSLIVLLPLEQSPPYTEKSKSFLLRTTDSLEQRRLLDVFVTSA